MFTSVCPECGEAYDYDEKDKEEEIVICPFCEHSYSLC